MSVSRWGSKRLFKWLGMLLAVVLFHAQAGALNCSAILSGEVIEATEDDRTACRIVQQTHGGDAKAQYEAAWIMQYGADELTADAALAFEWMEKAAKAGDARAALYVAVASISGVNGLYDEKQALRWFENG